MNSRLYRIKRGKEKDIIGIRIVTLRDCFYIVLCALIFAGLFKNTIPFLQTAQVKIANALTPKVEIAQAINIVSPLVTPEPLEFIDNRAEILYSYLKDKNSPLAEYTNLIVAEADKYDIGWTRLASMSRMESSFGNKVVNNSHNAWGIMAGNSIRHFQSWEDGIKEVSRLLGENYIWNMNKGIQLKYCPDSAGCNASWAGVVTETTQAILATEGK